MAAARRRLPMVAVDGATTLMGERGAVTLLGTFEGRRMRHRLLLHVAHITLPAAAMCRGAALPCRPTPALLGDRAYI